MGGRGLSSLVDLDPPETTLSAKARYRSAKSPIGVPPFFTATRPWLWFANNAKQADVTVPSMRNGDQTLPQDGAPFASDASVLREVGIVQDNRPPRFVARVGAGHGVFRTVTSGCEVSFSLTWHPRVFVLREQTSG